MSTLTQAMQDTFVWRAFRIWQRNRDAFVRSAMKRAKLPMMKRNALIAAGNALARRDDQILRSRVESIADDVNETDMVRDTARSVLRRLHRL